MKLSELKRDSAPEAEATPTKSGAVPEGNDGASGADVPTGVAQVVTITPSGIEVYYQSGPKRLYRIRQAPHGEPPYIDGELQDWVEVPSASTVLDVLEKGGLSWWGMKVGVEGVCRLYARADQGTEQERFAVLDDLGNVNVDGLVDRLKAEKLTVNHVKGAAADRGTNVHGALELFADTGVLPNPDLYPETEAGYVRGLIAFLKDTDPDVEHSELMVGSVMHGYAGRFDLVAKLNGTKYASKCYPKRASIIDQLQPGMRWLLDLKTSKSVYASYHLQTGAYEGAFEEDGYEPVDATGIVRVTADGKYELVPGRATVEDFVAVLEVSQIVRRLEGKS